MIDTLKKIFEIDSEELRLKKWIVPHKELYEKIKIKFDNETAELNTLLEKKNVLDKELRLLEDDITLLSELRKKEEKKLEVITSVKVAKAAETELLSISDKKNAIEEQMLEIMEKTEELEHTLHEKKLEVEKLGTEKKEAEDKLAEGEKNLSERYSKLDTEREELLSRLPIELSRRYKGIIESGIVPAIAIFKEDACQGCRVKLKQNMIAHLKANGHSTCDHCKRILISPFLTN